MREGPDRLSKTKDPVEQARLDKEFLENAKKRAQKSAERDFNQKIRWIRLNDSYSKEQLEFAFNVNWAKLEPLLKKRFNFRVEDENFILTEIKDKK